MAKLSKNDWVEKGFEFLAEKGIDGVKIEVLARSLDLSKGSFYWHFKNRDALIESMLDVWEKRATLSVIDTVDASSEDALERLKALIEMAFRPSRFDGTEASWRIGAAHNESIAKVCKRVDMKRISYVRDLLIAIGLPQAQSKQRAHLLYMVLIGNTTWVQTGGRKMSKKEVNEIVNMITNKT